MKCLSRSSTAYFMLLCLALLPSHVVPASDEDHPKYPAKVIICGVCKNIAPAAPKTIQNIETLGSRFSEYSAIIYENNSSDNTVSLLLNWSKKNPNVTLISEILDEEQLSPIRTENIARARNQLLNAAKDPKYHDFPYLIMVDLDFYTDWPFEEIVNTLKSPIDWDCVCSNSIIPGGRVMGGILAGKLPKEELFWDRYAFRDKIFPFGPEILGDDWWLDLRDRPDNWFKFNVNSNNWIPIFAGYGGLAIYKTPTVVQFSCGGVVTDDVKKFYQAILPMLPQTLPHLQKYLRLNKIPPNTDLSSIPVIFQANTLWEHSKNTGKVSCCDNIPLQASMSVNGYNKFFINPKLQMRY